jgi:hypothetical protein
VAGKVENRPLRENFDHQGTRSVSNLPETVTLQEVRLAYLASCGPSAAMIRTTNASRVDGMISIIVVAEGP